VSHRRNGQVKWGLAGYCPGPALASLALVNDEVLVFLALFPLVMGIARLPGMPK
jgi:hypothetical protein